MAEHDIEEKIESLRQIQMEIGPCEVITGGRDKKTISVIPAGAQHAKG